MKVATFSSVGIPDFQYPCHSRCRPQRDLVDLAVGTVFLSSCERENFGPLADWLFEQGVGDTKDVFSIGRGFV